MFFDKIDEILIKNQLFVNNSALEGGAILYLNKRPHFIQNNFTNNNAGYGENIASYPFRAKLIDLDSNMFNNSEYLIGRPSSDIPIFDRILIGFYDFDDQLVIRSYANKLLFIINHYF